MLDSIAHLFPPGIDPGMVNSWLRAALTIAGGLLAGRVLAGVVARVAGRFWPADFVVMGRRATYWTVLGPAAASALRELGFDLSVLLGAAGVLTVAMGFAAQTSASNLISGLFLALERSFKVGDAITVGTTQGEVLAIDLLSVKLRTWDNRLVRVPNETLVKSDITNLTRFPIRRADLAVGVAYKEDLAKVRGLLMALMDALPNVLEEPKPVVWVTGFGASSVDLQVSAWLEAREFFQQRSDLYEAVKRCLDEHGIEIPFPHVSLYTGEATKPLPVRVTPAGERP
ncbi:MAG: mechanosensitive ion channel family protein [Pseudomonadota bacterium]